MGECRILDLWLFRGKRREEEGSGERREEERRGGKRRRDEEGLGGEAEYPVIHDT